MNRRLLLIICVLFFGSGIAHAQTTSGSVEATGIRLTHTGGQVSVSFTLHAGKKATNPNFNLVVNPVLRGGATRRQLPSIVIRGRRSKVTDLRHELATGERRYEQPPVYMAPGESLDYTRSVPYEDWMRGGELVLEGVSVGCCSAREVDLGLLAGGILYAEPQVEIRVVAREVTVPQRSTGATLATRYPFIAPAEELPRPEPEPQSAPQTLAEAFAQAQARPEPGAQPRGIDYDMPLELGGRASAPVRSHLDRAQDVIASTRDGSISVYFRQGSHTIDRGFSDNNRNLVELVSAVRALASARDVRIARIVIAGFASPEGSPARNEQLARERARAVKEFLAANSSIDPATVELYNGGVDWQGLRALVERSDYYQKWRMLEIIDTVPVWDPYTRRGRLGELMRIEGGAAYRRMSREFFPQLRQAAYIKVYYEEK